MSEEQGEYNIDQLRKEFSALRKYAAMENATQDIIGVKKIYIDMTGDIKAAMVLDELIFWTLPRDNKISGLRIWKDGVLWLAVSRSEWWERKRLTERQADGAIVKLIKQDLVIKNVFKFNNFPTMHLRLNIPVFFKKYANALMKIHPPELEENTEEKELKDLYEMMGFPFSPNGENGEKYIPFSPNGDSDSPNGDSDSPNGENINSTHTSLTHPSHIAPSGAKPKPPTVEWAIVAGEQVTPDMLQTEDEQFYNQAENIAHTICMNNLHLKPLALEFMLARNILLSHDKKDQTGHRKALKQMYDAKPNQVKPEHIRQAVIKLIQNKMTVKNLFSVIGTAIDIANPPPDYKTDEDDDFEVL